MMNRTALKIKYSPHLDLTSSVLFLFTLLALMTLSKTASSQVLPSATNELGEYTLRVDANLVLLSATVVDHHNALVSGLVQERFPGL